MKWNYKVMLGVVGLIWSTMFAPCHVIETYASPVITAGQGVEEQTPTGPGEVDSEEVPIFVPNEEMMLMPVLEEVEEVEQVEQESTGRQIDPTKPMVALTIDDGPYALVGNQMMDCFAQYDAKATFFMVGNRIATYKTEVQRMVAEGHEVANHSMDHSYFHKLTTAQIQAQVNQCNDAIESACGVRPTLIRLPGGINSSTISATVGMPIIQWNIDTQDWKTRNADAIVAEVLNHVTDGDIILLHEIYQASGDAILRIVPELYNRGFQMVTVSEMAAAKGYTLEAGKEYYSLK